MKKFAVLLSFILLVIAGFIAYRFMPAVEVPQETSEPSEVVEIDSDANIVIESPASGDVVTSPITVTGQARAFENTIDWRILDGETVVESGFITFTSEDVGEFGAFEEHIFLPVIDGDEFTLEFFTLSARDGSVQDLVELELTLESVEKTSVEVYFSDPDVAAAGDCSAVDFEKRTVASTVNVAELAVLELLAGPEKAWAQTVIPEETELESVSIEDGTAYVRFLHPNTLEFNGGACRVATMQAQIEQTLLQFSTVDDVVISVNGIVRDIFQP